MLVGRTGGPRNARTADFDQPKVEGKLARVGFSYPSGQPFSSPLLPLLSRLPAQLYAC